MKAKVIVADDGAVQIAIADDAGKVVATVAPELPDGYSIEDVTALRSALGTERKARKDAEGRLKLFEGIDDADAARDALEKVKSGTLKGSKELDDAKKALEAKFAADKQATDREVAALEAQLAATLLDGEAVKAIAEHKGKVRALMPIVKQHARVEKSEDGQRRVVLYGDDGKPIVTKKAGSADPMGLGEFVGTVLKADPELSGVFEGSGTGGSGATHTAGGTGRGAPNAGQPAMSPEARLAAYHAQNTR